MLDEVAGIPSPLDVARTLVQLSPCATGMQHDERKSSVIFGLGKEKIRDPKPDAPLHPKVLERFSAPAGLQYDEMRPYRPDAMRDHVETKWYYRDSPVPPAS